MAKGSSSQAATNVVRGGATGGSSTAPPTAAGLRKRTTRVSSGTTSSVPASRSGATAMNFYTDDQPGIKVSPVVVVIMSIGFVIFVASLHIFGKVIRTHTFM